MIKYPTPGERREVGLLAAAPAALCVVKTVSRQKLAMLHKSRRDAGAPGQTNFASFETSIGEPPHKKSKRAVRPPDQLAQFLHLLPLAGQKAFGKPPVA